TQKTGEEGIALVVSQRFEKPDRFHAAHLTFRVENLEASIRIVAERALKTRPRGLRRCVLGSIPNFRSRMCVSPSVQAPVIPPCTIDERRVIVNVSLCDISSKPASKTAKNNRFSARLMSACLVKVRLPGANICMIWNRRGQTGLASPTGWKSG